MFPADTRILIVDDMTMMRKLVKAQLVELGYSQFFEAEHGVKALAVMEQQIGAKAPIQLILADWTMPVMTGIELLAKVRGNPEHKSIPFILVTAEGEVKQVTEAIKLGVSSFVRKPFTAENLKEKIETVWKTVGGKAA